MEYQRFLELAKQAPELFEVYGSHVELLATGQVCHPYYTDIPPDELAKIHNNVLVGLERLNEIGPYEFYIKIRICGWLSYEITVLGPDCDGLESDEYPTLLEAYIKVREAFVNG